MKGARLSTTRISSGSNNWWSSRNGRHLHRVACSWSGTKFLPTRADIEVEVGSTLITGMFHMLIQLSVKELVKDVSIMLATPQAKVTNTFLL